MTKRRFPNQAAMVKAARVRLGFSQDILAYLLGDEKSRASSSNASAQFISNIERELCGVPVKYMTKYCRVLNLRTDNLVDAMVADERAYLSGEIYAQQCSSEMESERNTNVSVP